VAGSARRSTSSVVTDQLRRAVRDGDADQDGLVDEFEKLVNADPSKADSDGDGLSDRIEIVRFHTDPSRADTDADGMTDGAEVMHGTTPGLAAFKFGKKDSDKDVLPDDLEKLIGTDPEASDTDHDGVADSLELSLGFDPLKWDTDGDGFSDGLERPAPTGVGTPAAPDTDAPPDAHDAS
jgi:hypothetical protein